MKIARNTICIVIVTYNRSKMLDTCLRSIEDQTLQPDMVCLVDNASSDDTQEVIEKHKNLALKTIRASQNLGGSGGFTIGLKKAYTYGHEWILLIDDDVSLHSDCIRQLILHKKKAMIAVRENREGALAELSALKYNLSNPFIAKPKECCINDCYFCRQEMPDELQIESAAFEGLMIHRDVVSKVGFPDPEYFIFYDDLDYTLRIRKQGFSVYAIRDAILVRQQDYDINQAINSWKGFYMYRNFFLIHFRYGENILVKSKPFFLYSAALIVKLITFTKYPKNFIQISKALVSAVSITLTRLKKTHRSSNYCTKKINL